ncbi:MAG: hypothetical protein M3N08_00080 [Pseudomonadota bacterium]|nr:hypothetical protein [Pseudomonadota bacterium]
MINLAGRAINAQKFLETFRDAIPGRPASIKRRGGVGFPISADSMARLDQQIQPALHFLDLHGETVKQMLAFDGVDCGSLDFGLHVDVEKLVFNVNNFLPLPLLKMAADIGLNIELSFYFGSELVAQNPAATRLPQVECTVTFLPPEEGGRLKPFTGGVLNGNLYRPHLVVDDPLLRKAAVNGDKVPETYLGVAFFRGPHRVKAGEPITAVLDLIYYPQISYDALQPGSLFTLREGPRIVAYGTILSRSH